MSEPVTLDTLADDPARALDLSHGEAAVLLAQAGGLVEVLRARMATVSPADNGNGEGEAGLLTVKQAAPLAGVTVDAFLRRARFRPAIVKLGHRTLRVNEKRLRRILSAMEA